MARVKDARAATVADVSSAWTCGALGDPTSEDSRAWSEDVKKLGTIMSV